MVSTLLTAQTWHHYGHAEGMLWNDCAGRALFNDGDGSLWIGTSHGLSHFTPGNRHQLRIPPPVLLTSIQFGKEQSHGTGVIEVPYIKPVVSSRILPV